MRARLLKSKTFIRQSPRTELLSAGMGLAYLPEWVRDTPTFKIGVQDGSIQVLDAPVPEPPIIPEAAPAPEATDAPVPEPPIVPETPADAATRRSTRRRAADAPVPEPPIIPE